MLLTRLWSTVLALAASAALVLVFLVGAGATGDFTKEDRSAIMGIADGGLVALEADLQSSAVVTVPQLLATPRLRAAIRGEMFTDEFGTVRPDVSSALVSEANDGLLKDHPLLTVGLLSTKGEFVASTGLDPGALENLAKLADYLRMRDLPEASLFTAVVNDKIHAVHLSRRMQDLRGFRTVSLEPIDLGGTSFLRRVLGDHPAGIVRSEALCR